MELLDAQIHPLPMVETHGHRALVPSAAAERLGSEEATIVGAACAIAAMDAVGVNGAVVSSLGQDLPTLASFVGLYPDRLVGVPGLVLLPDDRPADDFVAEIRATPAMVGVRLAVSNVFDPSTIEGWRAGRFEPFLAAAERHDLPLFILMYDHLPELHDALRAHPDLTVVIDHLGLPIPPRFPQTPALWDRLPQVLDLARFSNVVLKLTSAPALSVQSYPFADIWPNTRRLIDAFGADRVMWGSDYTRVVGLHTYRESVDFIVQTDQVTDDERAAICGGTLRRWLNWPGEADDGG